MNAIHRSLRFASALAMAVATSAGCSPPALVDAGSDSGTADVTRDASDALDMHAVDSPSVCTHDSECSDGVFCNGAERCMPSATGADARGCVAASPAAGCAAAQTCDEANDRCTGTCPDADSDGHTDALCGGDDCADNDAHRFPGNTEQCDSMGHDEDCDPCTVGGTDGDADHDSYVSHGCSNPYMGAAPMCDPMQTRVDGAALRVIGADCNDGDMNIHPGQTEACNGIDDNCNDTIDEGASSASYYPDCDNDGHGAIGSTAMPGCSPPSTPPSCPSGSTSPHWSMTADDCDDAAPARYPSAPEACNFIDDNCNCGDGVDPVMCIDEGLAHPVGATTSHFTACVGAPQCLLLFGSASRNPVLGGTEVLLDWETNASDYGAAWEPEPFRMGWGPMDITVRARGVADVSHAPGVAFAVHLARHVDGSSLMGTTADGGFPADHNGIIIEWVFNGAGADEIVALKHEAPPVTTSPVTFEMQRRTLSGALFDTSTDRPDRTFTIRYQTFRAPGGELLEVYDGATATGTPLIHLTPTSPGATVGYEFDVYQPVDVGVSAVSDATTRSRVYFAADYSGTPTPYVSTVARNGVCDSALP
jgi:hypothetical protein